MNVENCCWSCNIISTNLACRKKINLTLLVTSKEMGEMLANRGNWENYGQVKWGEMGEKVHANVQKFGGKLFSHNSLD
jgi:hypothetical protein